MDTSEETSALDVLGPCEPTWPKENDSPEISEVVERTAVLGFSPEGAIPSQASIQSSTVPQAASTTTKSINDPGNHLFPRHSLTDEELEKAWKTKRHRSKASFGASLRWTDLHEKHWPDLSDLPRVGVGKTENYGISGDVLFTGQTILSCPQKAWLYNFWSAVLTDEMTHKRKALYVGDGEDDLEGDAKAAEKHVIINMWTEYETDDWEDGEDPLTYYLPEVPEKNKRNKDIDWASHELEMIVKPPTFWKDAPDIKVTQLSQIRSEASGSTVRCLIVTDTTGCIRPTHVTHREFSVWEDDGIPTNAQLPLVNHMILDALTERNKLEERGCTVSWLDHCAMGLGRSPTAALYTNLLDAAYFGKKLPYLDHQELHPDQLEFADNYICHTVDRMNLFRSCIRTKDQYKWIHDRHSELLPAIQAKLGSSMYKAVRIRPPKTETEPATGDTDIASTSN